MNDGNLLQVGKTSGCHDGLWNCAAAAACRHPQTENGSDGQMQKERTDRGGGDPCFLSSLAVRIVYVEQAFYLGNRMYDTV